MGFVDREGKLHVTDRIDAGPLAKRTRRSLKVDEAWQWAEMEKLYASSGGRISYLGDWHTHPRQKRGYLSGDDINALNTIFAEMEPSPSKVISAILFGGRRAWKYNFWVASDWKVNKDDYDGRIAEALVHLDDSDTETV